MKTRTVTVCEGEDVGPIDWDHPTAKDKSAIWREAEKSPQDYVFDKYNRQILRICMYDGWPYWKPMPAIQYIGPLGSAEWAFFNSYGVRDGSIRRKPLPLSQESPSQTKP